MSKKVEIYKPYDCYEDMIMEYQNGKVKGTTTYNSEIDNVWTWRPQEFNIFTGYANEGKSLFVKQMSLIKSLEEKRKFIFSSPEDYPPKEFFDDMIHTLAGGSTDIDRDNYISLDLYQKAFDLIKDSFYFVYIPPPYNTIEAVIHEMEKITESEEIFGCVIDPILKFSKSKAAPERDDLYAGYIGSILTDFARRKNVCMTMVMHQNTPKLTEAGLYPKPNVYTVKGGGSWNDGVDNLLYLQRPYYAKDKTDDRVIFGSQKIKKQKLVGIPGDLSFRFNRKTNRYIDDKGQDLFYFDKFLN